MVWQILLLAQVQAAADRAGEPMWHLPLPDDYRKNLESEVADLRNISNNRYGGALTAGPVLGGGYAVRAVLPIVDADGRTP